MMRYKTVLNTDHLIPFNGTSCTIVDSEGDLIVTRKVYSQGQCREYSLKFDRPRMYSFVAEPLVRVPLEGISETLVEVLDSTWLAPDLIAAAHIGDGKPKHFRIYISDEGLLDVLSHSVQTSIV